MGEQSQLGTQQRVCSSMSTPFIKPPHLVGRCTSFFQCSGSFSHNWAFYYVYALSEQRCPIIIPSTSLGMLLHAFHTVVFLLKLCLYTRFCSENFGLDSPADLMKYRFILICFMLLWQVKQQGKGYMMQPGDWQNGRVHFLGLRQARRKVSGDCSLLWSEESLYFLFLHDFLCLDNKCCPRTDSGKALILSWAGEIAHQFSVTFLDSQCVFVIENLTVI